MICTRYEILKTKSDKCMLNAMKAETTWAREFWAELSIKLDEMAREEIIKL